MLTTPTCTVTLKPVCTRALLRSAHWPTVAPQGLQTPTIPQDSQDARTNSDTGPHRGRRSGWGAPQSRAPPALPLCFSLQVRETTLLAHISPGSLLSSNCGSYTPTGEFSSVC